MELDGALGSFGGEVGRHVVNSYRHEFLSSKVMFTEIVSLFRRHEDAGEFPAAALDRPETATCYKGDLPRSSVNGTNRRYRLDRARRHGPEPDHEYERPRVYGGRL